MKKSQPIRVIAAHRPVFATAAEPRRGMGERERERGGREGGREGGKEECREMKCGKDEEETERGKVKDGMTKDWETW